MDFIDNLNANLAALGITLPTLPFFLWSAVFNVVGVLAWRWGTERKQPVLRVTGVVLLAYTLVVSDFWIMFAVGVAGTAITLLYRNKPGAAAEGQ